MMTCFFWLLVGHAVCDYPLQGDFLARGKNRRKPLPGIPWYQCLMAHALIHAGAVMLVTNRLDLAVGEFMAHLLIDHWKCDGQFGFNADQALHVMFKAIWAVAVALPK